MIQDGLVNCTQHCGNMHGNRVRTFAATQCVMSKHVGKVSIARVYSYVRTFSMLHYHAKLYSHPTCSFTTGFGSAPDKRFVFSLEELVQLLNRVLPSLPNQHAGDVAWKGMVDVRKMDPGNCRDRNRKH